MLTKNTKLNIILFSLCLLFSQTFSLDEPVKTPKKIIDKWPEAAVDITFAIVFAVLIFAIMRIGLNSLAEPKNKRAEEPSVHTNNKQITRIQKDIAGYKRKLQALQKDNKHMAPDSISPSITRFFCSSPAVSVSELNAKLLQIKQLNRIMIKANALQPHQVTAHELDILNLRNLAVNSAIRLCAANMKDIPLKATTDEVKHLFKSNTSLKANLDRKLRQLTGFSKYIGEETKLYSLYKRLSELTLAHE